MEPSETAATELCRRRHPAEWDARAPRIRACGDCRTDAELVVDVYEEASEQVFWHSLAGEARTSRPVETVVTAGERL